MYGTMWAAAKHMYVYFIALLCVILYNHFNQGVPIYSTVTIYIMW